MYVTKVARVFFLHSLSSHFLFFPTLSLALTLALSLSLSLSNFSNLSLYPSSANNSLHRVITAFQSIKQKTGYFRGNSTLLFVPNAGMRKLSWSPPADCLYISQPRVVSGLWSHCQGEWESEINVDKLIFNPCSKAAFNMEGAQTTSKRTDA